MSFKTSHEELNIRLASVCENIVRSIVNEPELVTVSFNRSKETLIISVSPKDRGIIIGRGGQNLHALEDALLLGARSLLTKTQFTSYTLPSLEINAGHQERSRIPR